MDKIAYFKLQAKNFLRDFKTQELDEEGLTVYSPKFFEDIDELILSFDIDEKHFTLMNAQHLIACLAGFEKWSDLLHASDAALELGELLFNNRNQYYWPILETWEMYLYSNRLQDISDESKLELFRTLFPEIKS